MAAKRGSRGRGILSLNAVSQLLQITREKVLLLELQADDFPQHCIVRNAPHWDEEELELWIEENEYFGEDDPGPDDD